MAQASPTIKGIFVNSHIAAVRREMGEEGVRALAAAYGKPLAFRNSESIPVHEEVSIIESALDILTGHSVPANERAFEAGRLHFRNFSNTAFARIIFSMFKKEFKLMMLQTRNIAGHVFQGVRFTSVENGPTDVTVKMENADYPIDHFRGLFYEWMLFSGHTGSVTASQPSPGTFVYSIRWTAG